MGKKRTRTDLSNENAENISVPPGFASLTSFRLKKLENGEQTCSSTASVHASKGKTIQKDSTFSVFDVAALKRSFQHRPWILHDQNNLNPEKSDSEQVDMDFPSKACLPKGVARGCPDCSNCLKVTSRWRPEDARKDFLEEVPVFHPTEETVGRGRHNASEYTSQEEVTDISGSPPAQEAPGPDSDVPVNNFGQSVDGRLRVTIQDGHLEPGSKIARILRDNFLNRIDEEGWAWKKVSQDTKDFYWSEFQKNCIWYPDLSDAVVKKMWRHKAAIRYKDMVNEFNKAPEKGIKNIPQSAWNRWNQYWETPEFKTKSQLASQNRRGKSLIPSVHTSGSISATAHARRLAKQIGRPPTPIEVFRRIHTHKGDGVNWVDQRSRLVNESIENIRSQELQPEPGSAQPRLVDEADIYIRAVGGPDRSRIYGLGTLASVYMDRAVGDSTAPTVPSGVDRSKQQHMELIRTQQTKIDTMQAQMDLLLEQNKRMEDLISQILAAQQTNGPSN